MSTGTVVLIVLVIVLLGGIVPYGANDVQPGRPFYGTGYGGGGLLGTVLVIVLILVLLGKL